MSTRQAAFFKTGFMLFCVIFIACKGSGVSENEKATHLTDELEGTWRFIFLSGTSAKGDVFYPYGENLFGRLMYDAIGNMSVLLMHPDRPKFASDDMMKGTSEEIKAAFEGFDAYCGTYEVDAEKGAVTHHIQGSKFPNWLGTDQVRFFKISGDTLRLTAPPIMAGGVQWELKAVLVRF